VQVNLHAMTAGVAMLSLYSWLVGMRAQLLGRGRGCLPAQLAIITDKGKSSKEQGNLVVKEAVAAMTQGWHAPFRCCPSHPLDGITSPRVQLPCIGAFAL
jgi:pentatricopeptide repeat domain-containing protein 1